MASKTICFWLGYRYRGNKRRWCWKNKADGGGIIAHPIPWSWEFSKEPLKNKTDMAAIIGYEHQLPDDLIDFYPKQDESEVFDPNVIY